MAGGGRAEQALLKRTLGGLVAICGLCARVQRASELAAARALFAGAGAGARKRFMRMCWACVHACAACNACTHWVVGARPGGGSHLDHG